MLYLSRGDIIIKCDVSIFVFSFYLFSDREWLKIGLLFFCYTFQIFNIIWIKLQKSFWAIILPHVLKPQSSLKYNYQFYFMQERKNTTHLLSISSIGKKWIYGGGLHFKNELLLLYKCMYYSILTAIEDWKSLNWQNYKWLRFTSKHHTFLPA